jgi:DNA-binding CsgD family transcriptional regulator
VARLLAEPRPPVDRFPVLAAAVDILLDCADADGARACATELDGIAQDFGCPAVQAMAAYAAGRVELESGDAAGALPYLRRAMQLWNGLDCPYETARARVLVARACAALGDSDSSSTYLEAARRAFADLGTRPALAEVDRLRAGSKLPDGLTEREAEVLRLVASGKSNAQIAAALVLSEKTVARHLNNIFGKIDVGSRTAAAAYAFENDLA